MEIRAKAIGIGGTLKYVFPYMGKNASALGINVADIVASLKQIGIEAQVGPLSTRGACPARCPRSRV